MWFFEWWPYALGHGIDPFVTHAAWAPAGVNLAWTTAIPLVAILMAPVTVAFGPVVSYNIVAILAPVLSAWAAFVLCRYVTRSFWAALLGAYLYGFGSFELAHVGGELPLTLVFVPPLLVYLFLRRVNREITPVRFVVLSGVALAIQFSISTEVYLTLTVFGAGAVLLALALVPSARRRLRSTAALSVGGYALSAVLVSPYLYYTVAHGIPTRQLADTTNYSADLANFFFPTPITLLGRHAFAGAAQHFQGGNTYEKAVYLGLPLVAMLCAFVARFWREPAGKLLTLFLVGVSVAALGARLHVEGSGAVGLPWKLALHVPLVRHAIPARFAMYGFLAAGVMSGIWLADRRGVVWRKWGLAGLSVLFLLPNAWTAYYRQTAVHVPAFFSQGLYKRYLHEGDTVMILPLGALDEMLWQARSHMYFRLASGYIGSPYVDKTRVLDEHTGIPHDPAGFNKYVRSHGVRAIIDVDGAPVAPANRYPAEVWTRLRASFGVRPVRTGGVRLYLLR